MRMARVRQMATGRSRQPRPRCFRINHLALALALLFTGADDHAARRSQSFVRLGRVGCFTESGSGFSGPWRAGVTHRIERSTTRRGVTFLLSGDMDNRHVADLEALMTAESNGQISLDLVDVTLVDREAMTFLARVEAAGAVLVNCPEYVRRWIDAETGDA